MSDNTDPGPNGQAPVKSFTDEALEKSLRTFFDDWDTFHPDYQGQLWQEARKLQTDNLTKQAANRAASMVKAPDWAVRDIKTITDLRAEGDPPTAFPLIEQFVTQESSNLLVAPTNTGGSTLYLNMAEAALTGEPFLGVHKVHGGPYEVLWINPEESEHQPRQRLDLMGLSDEDSSHFHHLWTRDNRFYFDYEHHIDRMLTSLDTLGILAPAPGRTRLLFIDGFGGTSTGKGYEEDLEAWKNGLGMFRQASAASTVFVRTQTTAQAARWLRNKKKDGTFRRTEMEHAVGFQLATWPDHRHIISRDIAGRRIVEVRGRTLSEYEIGYVWNPETSRLRADTTDRVHAAAIIGGLETDADFKKACLSGDVDPDNKSSIARFLFAKHPEISVDTFRKGLQTWGGQT